MKALLYCPYTNLEGILAAKHVEEFIVVEPIETGLPSFYFDPSRLEIVMHKWKKRFQTTDVELAMMIEHYYSAGFVLTSEVTSLEQSPLTFECPADDRRIKLYYKPPRNDISKELCKDLKECQLVIDVSALRPMFPELYLRCLPAYFDLCLQVEQIRYRPVDFFFLEDRVRDIFVLEGNGLGLDFLINGPYENGLHNQVLLDLMYPSRMIAVNSFERVCQLAEDTEEAEEAEEAEEVEQSDE